MTTLKPFEDFYRAATRRNKTMAAKMVARLLASTSTRAPLGRRIPYARASRGTEEARPHRMDHVPKNYTDGAMSLLCRGPGLRAIASGPVFTGERLFIPVQPVTGNAAALAGAMMQADCEPRKVTNGADKPRHRDAGSGPRHRTMVPEGTPGLVATLPAPTAKFSL